MSTKVEVITDGVAQSGGPPLSIMQATPRYSASTSIEIERGKAEIQIKVLAAKAIGRDTRQIDTQMQDYCKDPLFADEAVYALPSKGEGPSVRFAEAVAQLWGHLSSGYIEFSHEDGQSVVEANCWDMCTNNTTYQRIIVKHANYSKQGGNVAVDDPSSIRQIINREAQKGARNVIKHNVPAHLWLKWFQLCQATNRSVKDIQGGLTTAFGMFKEKYGVTPEQIEAYIGAKKTHMSVDDYATLKGVWASIKDGEAKPSDYFPSLAQIKEKELAKPDTKLVAKASQTAEEKARARELGVDVQTQQSPKVAPTTLQAAPEQAEDAGKTAQVENQSLPTSNSPSDSQPSSDDMNRTLTPDEVGALGEFAAKYKYTPAMLGMASRKNFNNKSVTMLTVGEELDLREFLQANPKG